MKNIYQSKLYQSKSWSKIRKIEKINDSHFKILVKELPEKEKANEAVVNLLAKYFRINRQTIKIISGHCKRNKILEI